MENNLVVEWTAAEPDLTLSEITARLDDAAGYWPPQSVVHDFFSTPRRHAQKKTAHAAGPWLYNRFGLSAERSLMASAWR